MQHPKVLESRTGFGHKHRQDENIQGPRREVLLLCAPSTCYLEASNQTCRDTSFLVQPISARSRNSSNLQVIQTECASQILVKVIHFHYHISVAILCTIIIAALLQMPKQHKTSDQRRYAKFQRGLTEPKKRVLLKCGLSMGAMTGKLQNLHNMKNESLLCPQV